MLSTLFWVLVGTFIGWNIERPAYAKRFQEFAVTKWKEWRAK